MAMRRALNDPMLVKGLRGVNQGSISALKKSQMEQKAEPTMKKIAPTLPLI